ncbi:MAG: hypothetical protein R3B74_17635 [Nitrospirales bacterium]|nr:hypothetical protein [Nitrospirales bacterium]
MNYDYKGHWQRKGGRKKPRLIPISRLDQPGDGQVIREQSFKIQESRLQADLARTVEVSIDARKTWQVATI